MKENQVQPVRSWKRGFASFGKWLVRILGIPLLAGLVYQFVMNKVDEGRYPPPGPFPARPPGMGNHLPVPTSILGFDALL